MKNEMSDAIGLTVNKTPSENQYVCTHGYHFQKNNVNLGRILWLRQSELDGIYIEKDED